MNGSPFILAATQLMTNTPLSAAPSSATRPRRADESEDTPADLDERDDGEGLGGLRVLGMGADGAGMDRARR